MSISKLKGIAVFMVMLIMMIPIVHASELNLVYDANGNLVTGDGKYREYNSLNQLVRLRNGSTSTDPISEEYVHDPIAERILLKQIYNSSGQVSERVYYVDENFVRVVNFTGSYDFTYVKHEGQLVAQLNPDGTKLYVHSDHEGSSTVITNSSGQIIENTTYSPFGEVLSGGATSRFDSEGKEFDSVVGDYDFNFRKMNPSWGLFLQPDTLIPNVYDPQSLNRYMFERGNPYKNVDKDGHVFGADDAAIIAGIGFAADAIVFGYYSFMAYHELDPEKQRYYFAQATLTAVLASNGAPYDATIAAAGVGLFRVASRMGAFEALLPEAYRAYEAYQVASSVLEATQIVSSQAAYQNAYNHVSSNQNLNSDVKAGIQSSITNTAYSGNAVNWYYNEKKGTYQYWVGEGKPSNPDYKPISGSSGGSGSGSSSSSGSITLGKKK